MRIALWNANGLAQHKFELELFLKQQQIDVMLGFSKKNTRLQLLPYPTPQWKGTWRHRNHHQIQH